METFLHILTFTIPGLIVFFTAYYSIKLFMENEQKKREIDAKTNNQKISTPIKIQAFERLVLFLERINPESMLIRTQTNDMSAGQLHNDLLITVRAEFEHNLSQQIYISQSSWLAVKQSKEILIKIINEEASKLTNHAPATALSQGILIHIMSLKNNPIQIAIDTLKVEASNFI